MYKRILVPVDGSETSSRAVVAALQMARETGGRVRLLHALDELAYLSGYEYSADLLKAARDQGARVLEDAQAMARSADVPTDGKLVETAGRRLGELVAEEVRNWEADLVVVGTHGRRGMSRLLLGSGAEQVLRLAPVPVLAVRDPHGAD
ncbi:MAG TPA: universal stress protein [Ramlibacter sp.]|uniref:universal stress protein n=1 Tax=Ramlibacter sp. TaxID=1917967 RepID=UPI002D7E5D82|nr:universal stress protein [Ramlibacter sp.]HET8747846.1 universal stress protein [Ramlibacter sp.]